jgi:hypothetical protein
MSPCVSALRDERGFSTRANRNSTQNFHTALRAASNQRIISATKSVNLSGPSRLGEGYEFRDLAPGKYRLVAKAEDGAPALDLWDQYVTVEAGRVTQLPLSATNSKVKPDQFPGPPPK